MVKNYFADIVDSLNRDLDKDTWVIDQLNCKQGDRLSSKSRVAIAF